MGYDVSFHPISPEEMREWYFTPLTWIQQGQEEKVLALAAQHGMEDFYAEKYLNTLRVGAETESNELFDKSHGFYIAVIQGFFRDYYYTRGSAFSFLVEQKPEYPDVMDIGQMCEALGVSTKTGYKLLKDGKIEYLKIGRAYRIPKAHILRYLKITCSTFAE